MEYGSKAVAGSGLGLGIAGTALGVLNGGLGNLLGGWNNGANCCSDNMTVTRYDMNMGKELAAKDSEIALLKADAYTNQKFADLNDRYNDRFTNIEAQLARQAVHNQKTEDSFVLAQSDLHAVKHELECQIRNEAEKRCCGDNAIVNYVNATFYPKMVADVTTGTTTTAQDTFNPIPRCGCGCNGHNG
jgi:hypothetical protein